MRDKWFLISAVIALTASVWPARATAAWPEKCSSLKPDDQTKAKTIMAGIYPHDCCDDTLWNCLQLPKPSRLVLLLASGICFRVANGEADKDIRREMEKRAASMMSSGAAAAIDASEVSWAGNPDAPVQIIVYTCARCPFCSKSVPEIYDAVVNGNLKDKARLGIRIFPVKSHPGSKEGGFAFEAARYLGSFWPYVLMAYKRFDGFSSSALLDWAVEVGLPREEFALKADAADTRDRVVASKKEGLKNQVEATPTYFINGRLYRADLKTWALSCAIMEEYEHVTGNLCKPE